MYDFAIEQEDGGLLIPAPHRRNRFANTIVPAEQRVALAAKLLRVPVAELAAWVESRRKG